MSSECRAKNPATCRKHGKGALIHQNSSANDEVGKKEFYGEDAWNKVVLMQEQSKAASEVRIAIQNAVRDIEGFAENRKSDSETNQKKIVELLTNSELGSVKKEKESSAAVMEVRKNLSHHYHSAGNDGVSALVTTRLFKSLGRAKELGSDIRKEALDQAAKPPKGASFEANVEAIVSVLNKYKTFGDLEYKQLDKVGYSLIRLVKDQANGKHHKKPLELTYRLSKVRISIFSRATDGNIEFTKLKITDLDDKSIPTDFEGLDRDIKRIFQGED